MGRLYETTVYYHMQIKKRKNDKNKIGGACPSMH